MKTSTLRRLAERVKERLAKVNVGARYQLAYWDGDDWKPVVGVKELQTLCTGVTEATQPDASKRAIEFARLIMASIPEEETNHHRAREICKLMGEEIS